MKSIINKWKSAKEQANSGGTRVKVSFNIKPFKGPWGGSNQFVETFAPYLEHHGYEVSYDLEGELDVIWVIDPRRNSYSHPRYLPDDIKEYQKSHPDVLVIHRANNCDKRKVGSDTIDRELETGDKVADYTVFLSKWLRDYHAEKWFSPEKPHSVIWNAGDSNIYHPRGSVNWDGVSPFKLVTHHWSDNWMKGFDIYHKIDELIDSGELEGVQLTMIGRWPEDIAWKSAVLKKPLKGEALAAELRQHHAYITASRWEPGGMHFLEGIGCGLPPLCHVDGGGIPEVVETIGLVFNETTLVEKIRQLQADYRHYRQQALLFPHDGEVMCNRYRKVMESLLCARKGVGI